MSKPADTRSDAGLAAAFSMGPVILTITRVADGCFIEVNERFLASTGYTRAEVLGRTPLEVGLWRNPEQRAHGLKLLGAGQPVREVEADFHMKSGALRTCLMSADLVELNGEPCVLTALTDITDRKQTEAALARYHLLSDRARDIMLFVRPDGQIVEANAAASIAYGYDRATLLTKNIYDLRDPPTIGQIAMHMAQADTSGTLFTTVHRRSDGSTFPVEVSSIGAEIAGERLLLSIIRDITERRQAEAERAELLEREHAARIAAEKAAGRVARLQAITAALAQALTPAEVAAVVVEHGIAAMDAQQGLAALLAQDGAQLEIVQMVGYALEAEQACRSITLDAPAALAEAVRTLSLVAVEGTAPAAQLLPGRAGGDSGTLVAIPLIAEKRSLGAIGFGFALARSFSAADRNLLWALAQQAAQAFHRAQLYAAEQQARAAAEAAVRVRDTFLSTAAHELKTPLTVLLGNVQLLQRRLSRAGSLAERDNQLLRIVGEQATRLNRLIAAMLDLSRLQTEQLTITSAPLDLGALIRRVVDEVRPALTQHTLSYSLPDTPLMIVGDELRLEQVLQNLLSNAVKYSPAGGPIAVRAEPQAGSVRVSVADQGIGIPPANVPQLFQRFYRADNVDLHHINGMGIGLYVVRSIVELHGGQVAVASPETGGSVFTIDLPLAQS